MNNYRALYFLFCCCVKASLTAFQAMLHETFCLGKISDGASLCQNMLSRDIWRVNVFINAPEIL